MKRKEKLKNQYSGMYGIRAVSENEGVVLFTSHNSVVCVCVCVTRRTHYVYNF